MKKGWFNDNWKHALAAKGITTKRYMARAPARSLRRNRGMMTSQPVVYKPSLPYQQGTMGTFKKSIRRSDVLESDQGPRLLRAEKERDSLEKSLANLKKDADPEMRAELRAELKQRNEAIASMMVLPQGSKQSIALGERAAAASEKRARILEVTSPGKMTSQQEAAKALSDVQKSHFEQYNRGQALQETHKELIPKSGTKMGKKTVQDLLTEKQRKAEFRGLGSPKDEAAPGSELETKRAEKESFLRKTLQDREKELSRLSNADEDKA